MSVLHELNSGYYNEQELLDDLYPEYCWADPWVPTDAQLDEMYEDYFGPDDPEVLVPIDWDDDLPPGDWVDDPDDLDDLPF